MNFEHKIFSVFPHHFLPTHGVINFFYVLPPFFFVDHLFSRFFVEGNAGSFLDDVEAARAGGAPVFFWNA